MKEWDLWTTTTAQGNSEPWALVTTQGVGQLNIQQVGRAFFQDHGCALEIDRQFPVWPNIGDLADGPVHHVQIVIVAGLNHLVMFAKRRGAGRVVPAAPPRARAFSGSIFEGPGLSSLVPSGPLWVGVRTWDILDDVEAKGLQALFKQSPAERSARPRDR